MLRNSKLVRAIKLDLVRLVIGKCYCAMSGSWQQFAAVLLDIGTGKKVTKKNEKCWDHHFLTLYTTNVFFRKVHSKTYNHHLLGLFCGKVFTRFLVSGQFWWRLPGDVDLWRQCDVSMASYEAYSDFFAIIVFLFVILPSFISTDHFQALSGPRTMYPSP